MKTEYNNIKTEDGHNATTFSVVTKKGSCHGLFSEGRIYVHLISGRKCTKGLMNILVAKFKTNKITFTPLINCNVENKVKGIKKTIPPDDPRNPYGEPLDYLECEWIPT